MTQLRHFRPQEFGEWWPRMSVRLLEVLDEFRAIWGAPVTISPVEGALGRHMGPDAASQHNVDRWREVRAADVFPHGMVTRADAERAFRCAVAAGATGFGSYPHWQPQPGVHIDVRQDRQRGAPATWGFVRHDGRKRQVALTQAFAHYPDPSEQPLA